MNDIQTQLTIWALLTRATHVFYSCLISVNHPLCSPAKGPSLLLCRPLCWFSFAACSHLPDIRHKCSPHSPKPSFSDSSFPGPLTACLSVCIFLVWAPVTCLTTVLMHFWCVLQLHALLWCWISFIFGEEVSCTLESVWAVDRVYPLAM